MRVTMSFIRNVLICYSVFKRNRMRVTVSLTQKVSECYSVFPKGGVMVSISECYLCQTIGSEMPLIF
jgi:hypothetical protein